MKKNHYYCVTKDNTVIYISTSEKACDKILLSSQDYKKTVINTLGVLQNLKEQI